MAAVLLVRHAMRSIVHSFVRCAHRAPDAWRGAVSTVGAGWFVASGPSGDRYANMYSVFNTTMCADCVPP